MKKIKALVLSLVVTVAVSGLFFGLFAFVFAKTGNLPQNTVLSVLVTSVLCVAGMAGGFVGARVAGEKGLILGGGSSLVIAGCLCGISLLFFQEGMSAAGGARLAALFLCGCIGGTLGVNQKQKVKF